MVSFLNHREELTPAPVAFESRVRLPRGFVTTSAGTRISAPWFRTTPTCKFELLWCERGDLNPHEVAFTRS